MNPFTKLWRVKLGDWERALIVAVLTGPIGIIYDTIMAGSLTFDWQSILRSAIAGGLAYILKNFSTGEKGHWLRND